MARCSELREREAERRGEGEGRRVEEKERNERLVLRLRRTNNNTRFDTLEIIGKKQLVLNNGSTSDYRI